MSEDAYTGDGLVIVEDEQMGDEGKVIGAQGQCSPE